MLRRLKSWRNRFFLGPEFIGIRPPRGGKYQWVTVTAGYWLYALGALFLTPAGAVVVLASGLLTMYSLFGLAMPIHLLAFTVAALVLVDVIVGFLVRPGVMAARDLPTRMGAGGEHKVRYTIENPSRRPAWDILLDALPLPRGLRFPEGRPFLRSLKPGERRTVTTTLKAERRGTFILPVMHADTVFPFHLWRWGRRGTGGRRLTVYPRFTRLSVLEMGAGTRYHPGGVALSSKIGQSMEFLGCRDFRAGDDLRHIHWRSWARTGSPVVKEFREEYLCRTALIVDTLRPQPYFWDVILNPVDPAFEATMSLSAAIADWLAERDYIVDLFAAGPEVYRFQGGRSLGYLENILDILACLGPHHEEPFAEFSEQLIQEIAQISSAVFVLLAWNDVRRDLMDAMVQAGVTVKAILVNGHKDVPEDLPGPVRVVSAADVTGGHCDRL